MSPRMKTATVGVYDLARVSRFGYSLAFRLRRHPLMLARDLTVKVVSVDRLIAVEPGTAARI